MFITNFEALLDVGITRHQAPTGWTTACALLSDRGYLLIQAFFQAQRQ